MAGEEVVSVESLFGGQVADEKTVLAGMSTLETSLKADFYSALEQRDAMAPVKETVRGALVEVIGRDQMTALAEDVRGKVASFAERELASPETVQQTQRIFLGSIGATVGVPFNYQWTWSAGTGSPSLSVSANRTTGLMSFGLAANFSNGSSGGAAAALGIYFRPMVANGILRLSANPAFTNSWLTACAFCSAHSDGWIGLYVGQYNLSGGFDATVVDQRISLWSDDSWWYGVGPISASNSAFPLFAQMNVDSSHWYALWVWCGGNVSACGFGSPFWGSGATGRMSVTLPSITWELF
jgi:hypothetical protein